MSAFTALNTALFNQLAGGAALVSALGGTAIYFQHAPDDAPLPFVVWSYAAGGDENMTPNRTKNLIVLVRTFAATRAQGGTLDALVDARLHMQELTVSGWKNFWMARETEVSLVENLPNTDKTYVTGAQYRCRLDQN